MARAKTIDRDRGAKAIYRATRAVPRLGHRVGVFDPAVAKYALIQEGERPFMRPAADDRDRQQDAAAARIHDAIVDGNVPTEEAAAFAEHHAERIRANIEREGLIDTGALLDSIEVREGDR